MNKMVSTNGLKNFWNQAKKVADTDVETVDKQDENNQKDKHYPGVDIFKTDMKVLGEQEAYWFRGSTVGLLSCMRRILYSIEYKVKIDVVTQEKFKRIVREELEQLKIQKMHLEDDLRRLKDDHIPGVKEKIAELKEYIRDLKSKRVVPDQTKDSIGKLNLVILGVILSALSVYLFVFYSSASYSAFFRDFTPDQLGISHAIFDPRAVSNAYKEGILELVLILSMPFIFFGLGFLIHKFVEQKSLKANVKISILILLTFIFDFILALHITRKIYNVEREMSFDENIPPFKIVDAFQTEDFWMIIFAGFLVYIIWGFLLEFAMKGFDGLNKLKYTILNNLEAKEDQEKKLLEFYEEEKKVRKEIKNREEEIVKNQERLNGVIIPVDDFRHVQMDFVVGWIGWMSFNGMEPDQIKDADEKANTFIENSITELRMISLKK